MDNYGLIKEIVFNVSIVLSILLLTEDVFKKKHSTKLEYILVIILAIIYILIFGNRPIIELTDTYNYVNNFIFRINNLNDALNYRKDNFFYIYSYLIKQFVGTPAGYLTCLAITYIVPYVLLVKKLNLKHPFLFFVLLTCTFSFNNLGVNIMRQGFGISFFLLAVVNNYKNNNKKAIIYFLIAILSHTSLVLSVAAFLVSKYVNNKYLYLGFYIATTVISVLNIKVIEYLGNLPIIGEVFLDRAAVYDNVIGEYKVGFRIDFYAYNTFFLLLILYIYQKYKFKEPTDKTFYGNLLRTYVLLSGYFYLMFSQSFSDRYGVLSWVIVPLFFVPFYQKNSKQMQWINATTLFIIYALISYIFKYK